MTHTNVTPLLVTTAGADLEASSSTSQNRTEGDVISALTSAWLPWEDPRNLVSAASERFVYIFLACGVSNVLCVTGVPLNLLSLAVFAKQGLGERINVMLFALSLSDLVLVVSLVAFRAPCWLRAYDVILARNVETAMNNTVYYVTYIFSSVSQFLVAILSVDRSVSLAFPFFAKRRASYTCTAAAVVATYLFFLAIFFPHFFFYSLTWGVDPATNRSLLYPLATELGQRHAELLLVFTRDLGILTVKPLATALVVFSSAFTLAQLHRAGRSRAAMTSSRPGAEASRRGGEAKISRMLLFLSAVSVLCCVPEISISYVNLFEPEFQYYRSNHNLFLVLFYVTYVLWSLNATANFFVYVIMSSRFRRTLLGLLPRCLKVAAGKSPGSTSAWAAGLKLYDSGHDPSSAVTEVSSVL